MIVNTSETFRYFTKHEKTRAFDLIETARHDENTAESYAEKFARSFCRLHGYEFRYIVSAKAETARHDGKIDVSVYGSAVVLDWHGGQYKEFLFTAYMSEINEPFPRLVWGWR